MLLLFLFLVVLFLLTFDVDVSSCFFSSPFTTFTSAAHHIVLLSMICVDVYFPKIWNYVRCVINY